MRSAWASKMYRLPAPSNATPPMSPKTSHSSPPGDPTRYSSSSRASSERSSAGRSIAACAARTSAAGADVNAMTASPALLVADIGLPSRMIVPACACSPGVWTLSVPRRVASIPGGRPGPGIRGAANPRLHVFGLGTGLYVRTHLQGGVNRYSGGIAVKASIHAVRRSAASRPARRKC